MANTIDKKWAVVYNNLQTQNKQIKEIVTPEEWNTLFNTLANQADTVAEALDELKSFFIGKSESEGEFAVPEGYDSLVDFIMDSLAGEGVTQIIEDLVARGLGTQVYSDENIPEEGEYIPDGALWFSSKIQ